MTVTVRPAIPDDVPALMGFIHKLAAYEREPDAVRLTERDLLDSLFADPAHVFAHVAEVDGSPVGMALWFLNYSTWEGRHGVYVEDLFVDPAHRGHGAGRALLAALASLCARRGYARLDLSVLDWNTPAIGFYEHLGAVGMHEWTVHRFNGAALRALAG